MKTYYILYYYNSYAVSKTYTTHLQATTEIAARDIFIQQHPGAIIKGIEDYPPA